MGFFEDLMSMFGGGKLTGGGLPDYSAMEKQLQQMYGQGRGDISQALTRALGYQQPFMQAGKGALGTYLGTLGLGTQTQQQEAARRFQESPGYQYQLQQGTQAAERAAAARGMMGSGAEQRALQRVGQGLASQQYGQWQQRLAGLSGMGAQTGAQMAQEQTGAGRGLASLGAQYGGLLSNLYGRLAGVQAQEMPYQYAGLGALGQGIGQLLPYIAKLF